MTFPFSGARSAQLSHRPHSTMWLKLRGVSVLKLGHKTYYKHIRKDEKTGILYAGTREISVVYFRFQHNMRDFPSEEHWKARELLEMSRAIKCPSINFMLAGVKNF